VLFCIKLDSHLLTGFSTHLFLCQFICARNSKMYKSSTFGILILSSWPHQTQISPPHRIFLSLFSGGGILELSCFRIWMILMPTSETISGLLILKSPHIFRPLCPLSHLLPIGCRSFGNRSQATY
jgi:hypothetical protein